MQKYQPLEQIGKGSFGVVRKIRRISDDQILVWKQINFDRMTSRQKQQLVTQVNILKELKHPNIVKYEDRIVDKKATKVFIIMEYCSGGDLGRYLKQCKKDQQHPIAQEIIWKIAYQLLLALEYCHSRTSQEKGKCGKVLHRDIKPANIFINDQNHIKLGDFGLSREMGEHSQFAQTHVGTPYYMSPEQVRNQNYNEKSDIWSAGCLIYELAALKRPFEASNHLALAKRIEQGRYERIPFRYSESLHDLITKMLVVNPEHRHSAKDLLTNRVFKMRAKQEKLKEQISSVKEREARLREKEREIEYQLSMLNFQEEPLVDNLSLNRKKWSRQSKESDRMRYGYDKENRDRSNFDYS